MCIYLANVEEGAFELNGWLNYSEAMGTVLMDLPPPPRLYRAVVLPHPAYFPILI